MKLPNTCGHPLEGGRRCTCWDDPNRSCPGYTGPPPRPAAACLDISVMSNGVQTYGCKAHDATKGPGYCGDANQNWELADDGTLQVAVPPPDTYMQSKPFNFPSCIMFPEVGAIEEALQEARRVRVGRLQRPEETRGDGQPMRPGMLGDCPTAANGQSGSVCRGREDVYQHCRRNSTGTICRCLWLSALFREACL